MNTHKNSLILLYLTLALASCQDNTREASRTLPQQHNLTPKTIPTVARSSTRFDMSCLPQLQAMLTWYGTSQLSSDTTHHFHFVGHSSSDLANAYYVVDDHEVARYLAFLQKSGFFSAQYLASERADLQSLKWQYAHERKLLNEGEPNEFVLDRLLGVTNVSDVMTYNQTHHMWKFLPGSNKNTIKFETGDGSVMTYAFDSNCKISSVSQ